MMRFASLNLSSDLVIVVGVVLILRSKISPVRLDVAKDGRLITRVILFLLQATSLSALGRALILIAVAIGVFLAVAMSRLHGDLLRLGGSLAATLARSAAISGRGAHVGSASAYSQAEAVGQVTTIFGGGAKGVCVPLDGAELELNSVSGASTKVLCDFYKNKNKNTLVSSWSEATGPSRVDVGAERGDRRGGGKGWLYAGGRFRPGSQGDCSHRDPGSSCRVFALRLRG